MAKYDWTYIDPIIRAIFPINGARKALEVIYQLQNKTLDIKCLRNRARYIHVYVDKTTRAELNRRVQAGTYNKKISLKESDAFISKYYPSHAADYCAEHTGNSRRYIVQRACTLGIHLNANIVAHINGHNPGTRPTKNKTQLPTLERLALGLSK